MRIGVVRESGAGERRVALTPNVVKSLAKAGFAVAVESGAGVAAGFADEAYVAEGATVMASRAEVFAACDVLAQVRMSGFGGCNDDLAAWRPGLVVLGMTDALTAPRDALERLASTGVTALAMELMPRITRAQSMDVLSSQATVAGYKAVLIAANHLGSMFPLMMTAAGTLPAARVFVIGAGVAGLQAIATAKRLGAIVSAYDVRPAAKDQVTSVGGRFVEMPVAADAAEDKGGYARVMGEAFYAAQRQFLADAMAGHDVVITTAAVPGARSPLLVTADAVRRLQRGGIVIDLAAERGGNCELTKADERVDAHGVTIVGPTNLAATVPHDASLMYARNVLAYLQHLASNGGANKDGVGNGRGLSFDRPVDKPDEILDATLVARGGSIVNSRVRERLERETAAAA
ncbi:MAG: NAD(P) transhydrogenase subunit alpha [Phycisphaerae bacterium]|nr:NAD(P) transhydrogenase subunit alpha [Phycisphaerae bacterium]